MEALLHVTVMFNFSRSSSSMHRYYIYAPWNACRFNIELSLYVLQVDIALYGDEVEYFYLCMPHVSLLLHYLFFVYILHIILL